MTTKTNFFKNLKWPLLFTSFLLLIPLVAMQLTTEVVWTLSDFVIAGFLLLGTFSAYTLITRTSSKTVYKIAVGLGLFSSLLMIWANLAVGLIGSENESFNMIYFGVLALGVAIVLLGRFKTKAMEYAFYAMGLSTIVVVVVALSTGMQYAYGSSTPEILGVNAFFIFLFFTTGSLFNKVGSNQIEISSPEQI